jgi:quinol monooxygenase YgiN
MSEEIAVIATVQASPGLAAEVEAAIRPCIDATRREAGCRLYTVHTDLEHPGRFVFIERWASREALAAHEKEAHFLAMVDAFRTRLQGPIQVQMLRELT